MIKAAARDLGFQSIKSIDGNAPILHGSGCAMGRKDDGGLSLFRKLRGYPQHANSGGILLFGLGCKAMQGQGLVGAGRLRQANGFRHVTVRQDGGTRQAIATTSMAAIKWCEGYTARKGGKADINCGDAITFGMDNADKSGTCFEVLLAATSGRLSNPLEERFGGTECAPWQFGAVR